MPIKIINYIKLILQLSGNHIHNNLHLFFVNFSESRGAYNWRLFNSLVPQEKSLILNAFIGPSARFATFLLFLFDLIKSVASGSLLQISGNKINGFHSEKM